MPEYPVGALREALINAVAHRDYERSRSETEVVFYDDRVEVSSPGLLAEGVTVHEVKSGAAGHATRNPTPGAGPGRRGAHAGREVSDSRSHVRGDEEEPSHGTSFHGPPRVSFTVSLRNEPEVAPAGPGWKHVVGGLGIDPGSDGAMLLARPDGFTAGGIPAASTPCPTTKRGRRIGEMVDRDIVHARVHR